MNRWLRLNNRFFDPWSNGNDPPLNTCGNTWFEHANRRACPALTRV